jgi:hypothetical protein
MSRIIMRVVFAVLISLVLIAAVSPNVKAKLESLFQKADVSNAASTSVSTENQTLEEETVEQVPVPSQFDKLSPPASSHECNSDPTLDY